MELLSALDAKRFGPPAICRLILAGWVCLCCSREVAHSLFQVSLEASGNISKENIIALGSVNLEKLLGAEVDDDGDFVATKGGDLLEMTSRVVAVISPRRESVELLY